MKAYYWDRGDQAWDVRCRGSLSVNCERSWRPAGSVSQAWQCSQTIDWSRRVHWVDDRASPAHWHLIVHSWTGQRSVHVTTTLAGRCSSNHWMDTINSTTLRCSYTSYSCLFPLLLFRLCLTFSCHINAITQTSNRRRYLILKCFQSRDRNLLIKAFITYVRPLLETNSHPHLLKDIRRIDAVQRRLTKKTWGPSHTYLRRVVESTSFRVARRASHSSRLKVCL